MSLRAALFMLQIVAAGSATAAEPVAPTCTVAANLGATPFAAWTLPDGDRAAAPEIGRPVTLSLENGAASRWLRIDEAGRYGIAADGKVWIDIRANGAPLASVGHGHGPACSGNRKIVWFTLAAGAYELALSKTETASVRLLVIRAP